MTRYLLAAGLLCGAAVLQADEPGATVQASAGYGVSVSDDSAAIPVVHVVTDAPIYLGDASVARVRAALSVNGSPGATLDLGDVTTFQGAELSVELSRRIGAGNGSATFVALEGGGAARRDADGEAPRERFPGWWSARLGFEHRDGDKVTRRLTVGLGNSQIVHPRPNRWPRDLMVSGQVDVPLKGSSVVRVSGDIMRCGFGCKPGDRSVFRLAVTVGI